MGGLGPNIGGEEWERGRKKQEIYSEFGKQIRLQNLNKQGVKKTRAEKPRELSRREKAIEYANSVLRAKPPKETPVEDEDFYAEDEPAAVDPPAQ